MISACRLKPGHLIARTIGLRQKPDPLDPWDPLGSDTSRSIRGNIALGKTAAGRALITAYRQDPVPLVMRARACRSPTPIREIQNVVELGLAPRSQSQLAVGSRVHQAASLRAAAGVKQPIRIHRKILDCFGPMAPAMRDQQPSRPPGQGLLRGLYPQC